MPHDSHLSNMHATIQFIVKETKALGRPQFQHSPFHWCVCMSFFTIIPNHTLPSWLVTNLLLYYAPYSTLQSTLTSKLANLALKAWSAINTFIFDLYHTKIMKTTWHPSTQNGHFDLSNKWSLDLLLKALFFGYYGSVNQRWSCLYSFWSRLLLRVMFF